MNQSILTLLLGLLLGIKHAFEADHLLAVTTLVAEHKNPVKASMVGTFWGIGHTTTLFIVGTIVLLFKIKIPHNLSLFLESLVGLMLVFLGVRALKLNQSIVHTHSHRHKKMTHIHRHLHHNKLHLHRHRQSFLIGSIHGLAGSGALMILVLVTVRSTLQGLYYLLLFGFGLVLSMTIIGLMIGIPFSHLPQKFPKIEGYLRIIAGMVSIIFGVLIIYEIIVSSFFV